MLGSALRQLTAQSNCCGVEELYDPLSCVLPVLLLLSRWCCGTKGCSSSVFPLLPSWSFCWWFSGVRDFMCLCLPCLHVINWKGWQVGMAVPNSYWDCIRISQYGNIIADIWIYIISSKYDVIESESVKPSVRMKWAGGSNMPFCETNLHRRSQIRDVSRT